MELYLHSAIRLQGVVLSSAQRQLCLQPKKITIALLELANLFAIARMLIRDRNKLLCLMVVCDATGLSFN
jgi:hypothetical protein